MKFLEKNSKVSNGFIAATLLSIAGSIVIWNTAGADPAHVERLASLLAYRLQHSWALQIITRSKK